MQVRSSKTSPDREVRKRDRYGYGEHSSPLLKGFGRPLNILIVLYQLRDLESISGSHHPAQRMNVILLQLSFHPCHQAQRNQSETV